MLFKSFVLRMHGTFFCSPPEKLANSILIHMQQTGAMNVLTVTEQV